MSLEVNRNLLSNLEGGNNTSPKIMTQTKNSSSVFSQEFKNASIPEKKGTPLKQYGINATTFDNAQLSKKIPLDKARFDANFSEFAKTDFEPNKTKLRFHEIIENSDGSTTYTCTNGIVEMDINVKHFTDGTTLLTINIGNGVRKEICDTETGALLYQQEPDGTQHFYLPNGCDVEYNKKGKYLRTYEYAGNVFKGAISMGNS